MDNQAASPLVLTLAYWLHMLATVVWIGGLAALALFVLPAARKSLPHTAYTRFLTGLQARFQQVGWFSLAVLAVTGMFQMSAHPAYGGFLAIDNDWSVAILSKHLVIGLMVLVSAYMTWGVLPALQRAAMLQSLKDEELSPQARTLQKREALILRINLVLSFLVLLLTAWARSSG